MKHLLIASLYIVGYGGILLIWGLAIYLSAKYGGIVFLYGIILGWISLSVFYRLANKCWPKFYIR